MQNVFRFNFQSWCFLLNVPDQHFLSVISERCNDLTKARSTTRAIAKIASQGQDLHFQLWDGT